MTAKTRTKTQQKKSRTPTVALRKVSHTFGEGASRRKVLMDIDLDLYPGEMVILTGPSGSGKTTLLTLIGALRALQAGSIRVNGLELRNMPAGQRQEIRRHTGFIFQDHNLFEALTAAQTLRVAMELFPGRYSSQDYEELPRELLSAVGMRQYADTKPEKLSTGQKQRIAITRALINDPSLVLADEPTAALDKDTTGKVIELLKKGIHGHKATVLLVTHDSRIFDVADRVVTIVDGRIVEITQTS